MFSVTQFKTNELIPHLPQVETSRDLLSDESFILPSGIESYSTDGDHLPLPPGRRRELDQHFFGELWEPDAYLHQGYERDPLSTLPLEARMQAHIHKHRSDLMNTTMEKIKSNSHCLVMTEGALKEIKNANVYVWMCVSDCRLRL